MGSCRSTPPNVTEVPGTRYPQTQRNILRSRKSGDRSPRRPPRKSRPKKQPTHPPLNSNLLKRPPALFSWLVLCTHANVGGVLWDSRHTIDVDRKTAEHANRQTCGPVDYVGLWTSDVLSEGWRCYYVLDSVVLQILRILGNPQHEVFMNICIFKLGFFHWWGGNSHLLNRCSQKNCLKYDQPVTSLKPSAARFLMATILWQSFSISFIPLVICTNKISWWVL